MALFKKSQKIKDAKEIVKVLNSNVFLKWLEQTTAALPFLSTLSEEQEQETNLKLEQISKEFIREIKKENFEKEAVKWVLLWISKILAPSSLFIKQKRFKDFKGQILGVKKVASIEKEKEKKAEAKEEKKKVASLEEEVQGLKSQLSAVAPELQSNQRNLEAIQQRQTETETIHRAEFAKIKEAVGEKIKINKVLKEFEKMMDEKVNDFGRNFAKNTGIFQMPDFRKLAMGLQQQIDEKLLKVETPSGIVDGINTTFTIGQIPAIIVVNGMIMSPTEDYTLDGKTITFIIAPPTTSILRSIYL